MRTLAAIALSAFVVSAQQQTAPQPVDEVGVYVKTPDGQWKSIPPEIVNWKTGGVLKSVGTLGVVKGDINGRLPKGNSRTRLSGAIDLLVYASEGSAIEEYQLIKLRTHPDSREFRTVTGGIFHVSGGAERDTIEFESSKVAKRTWTIHLVLAPGEYGILPPGSYQTSNASAQLGKLYTFAIDVDAAAPGAIPFEKPKKHGW